jgi:hypothetical protein
MRLTWQMHVHGGWKVLQIAPRYPQVQKQMKMTNFKLLSSSDMCIVLSCLLGADLVLWC